MKEYNETYFDHIYNAAAGRLRPDGISGFFLATFLVGLISTVVSALAVKHSFITVEPYIQSLVDFAQSFLIFHLIVTVLFFINRLAFKFQKIQALLLSIFGLKLSLDFYLPFYAIGAVRGVEDIVLTAGTILLAGGLLLLLLMMVRSVNLVKKGELQKGGGGFFGNKKQKNAYVSIPIIFGVTMIAGVLARSLGDISMVGTVLLILFFAVFLQYAMTFALPEFLLLTYCKFRFEKFNIDPPNKYKKGKNIKQIR